MALMAEETALLIEKGVCVLCDLTNIIDKPSDEQKQIAADLEKKLLEQQSDSLKRKRSEQLSQKIDIILADVKIDKEVLLQEEINKLPTLSSAHVLLHLPLEHPWPTEQKVCSIEDLKPSVLEGKKLVNYLIYKDLWQKGHYITEGSKFGANYLVYPVIVEDEYYSMEKSLNKTPSSLHYYIHWLDPLRWVLLPPFFGVLPSPAALELTM
ncbi:hypothetical protein EVAR_82990_1 [Eumeta japonica]|uniref:tRNA-intron lyase n=1 Tax=Eumeta variegata TaxID=151549 RepID=A0A4C1VR76_EUMVA|nr:hypothetical protein EVAR_82990_1 [Eumeta japonica]